MPEINIPPCPLHGDLPRALHTENFEGIVQVIDELLLTVSGVVGTTTYTRCPYGYPYNFEGVVRALEDLNASISGIQGGGGGVENIIAGSGVYVATSGIQSEIGVNLVGFDGVSVTYSGSFVVVSGASPVAVAVVSGIVGGNGINVTASGDTAVVSTDLRGEGLVDFGYLGGAGVVSGITNTVLSGANTTVTYSGIYTTVDSTAGGGASVTVSGEPGSSYTTGDLWFDTNEGRLLVYASGNGVSDPAWYQTNAEAIALKSEAPPSGTGDNAPPRDGSIWYNTLMGSLFVYDAVTSGWYETGPSRSFAYGPAAPAPSTQGAGWFDSSTNRLKVWDGSAWIDLDIDGGVV